MIRCGRCRKEYPYDETGLAEWEARLRLGGSLYREGWTRYVRNEWACAECVRTGLALRADPARQRTGRRGPFFAYWDQARTCGYCGGPYTFTALEQRSWYEERRLSRRVHPIACPPCRRAVVAFRQAQKRLAERLATLDPSAPAQLVEVGELELQVGSLRKGLEYLRRARNRGVSGLEARLAQVEAEGVPPAPSTHWGRIRQAWDPLEQAR